MPNLLEQKCPLCLGNAIFTYLDHKNRKHYKCNAGQEFVVTVDAEKKLSNCTSECRLEFSERAKLSIHESIFEITQVMSTLRKSDMACAELNGEFVNRTEAIQ
jgi:hypothetical protein